MQYPDKTVFSVFLEFKSVKLKSNEFLDDVLTLARLSLTVSKELAGIFNAFPRAFNSVAQRFCQTILFCVSLSKGIAPCHKWN
jgi:hypothetical protein